MTATAAGTGARPARQVPGSRDGGLALLWRMRRDPLTLFSQLRREHGMIARLRVPRLPLYLVSDPAAIQEALTGTGRAYAKGLPGRSAEDPGDQPLQRLLGQGLVTAPQQLWRRQRRLIQPLFHQDRISGYGAAFAGLAEEHSASWRDGETRDLHRDMTELTLAIIARTVFDVALRTDVVLAIRTAMQVNQALLPRVTMPGRHVIERLPLPSNRRFDRARHDLDKVVYQLIADRRARGAADQGAQESRGDDLLSLLLSARDADTGEPMSDEQVRDEAMTLLLAGHETTANALAWAWHLLGANPDAQRRMHAELDEVLGGRLPCAADLPDLPYTGAVLHEAMRLYPPVWMMVRRLVEEHDVCGYRLPAGSLLLLSQWVVHHDPQLWPEPDIFQPGRWLDSGSARPRYAYFPFGGGPRQCIGNSFSEMEGTLVLATVGRAWSVSPAPGCERVVPQPFVTLRPSQGVPMTVQRRAG